MATTLTSFMVRLAIDPEKFNQFLTDPEAAARSAGLSTDDLAVLLSGDQNRIYAALITGRSEGR